MQSSSKKAAFVIITVILLAGVFIYQKQAKGGDSFEAALAIMQNLKSSALTADQATILETAFQESIVRIDLLEDFVATDVKDIKDLITASTTAETAFVVGIKNEQGSEEDLREYIDTNQAGLTPAQQEGIYTIASKMRRTNKELSLRLQFISTTAPTVENPLVTYGYLRSGLCTTESTSEFDPFTVGTVTPQFPSTAQRVTFAAKSDTCGIGANIGKVTQYRCVEREFRNVPDHAKNFIETSPCEFGCLAWMCNRGELGTVTVTSDADGDTPLVNIVSGQPFYIQVATEREDDEADLTIDISSPKLTGASPVCTLTTRTVNLEADDESVTFGPVICTAAATFTLSLKDGTREIDTATSGPIAPGTNAMKELVVTAPSDITTGEATEFTIQAMGQNGLPYNAFDKPVILIVDPALDAENNTGKLIIKPTTQGTLSLTFPEADEEKTYTVFARGGEFSSTPITVVVPAATAE